MLSLVTPERRVSPKHPLRAAKKLADAVLPEQSPTLRPM